MNKVLILLLGFTLLFGCLAQQQPTPAPTLQPATSVQAATGTPTATQQPTAQSQCKEPDVKFGGVNAAAEVTYGSTTPISAEIIYEKNPCSEEVFGATIGLYDGKRLLSEKVLTTLMPAETVQFVFVPDQTREYALTLRISPDAETEVAANNEYPISITGLPFGFFDDISGDLLLEFNSANMKAQAFVIEKPTPVRSIEVMLRKIPGTMDNSEIYLQIRPDASNKPSGVSELALSNGFAVIPTTLSWVKFDTPQKTTLRPGVYWLVLKTMSSVPSLYVHAVKDGKYGKDGYTMKSTSQNPLVEMWEKTSDGPINFRLANDPLEVIDQGAPATPNPSLEPELNPYD